MPYPPRILHFQPTRLPPPSSGLVGIQIAHDIAHSVAASARNVTLGVPIYVPSLQVRQAPRPTLETTSRQTGKNE